MSKLTAILEDQLAEAKAKAGSIIVRRLNHGLRIELTCINTDVYLTLTRDDQYPSIQEWETITAHFPYHVPKVTPLNEQAGSRYTLFAKLPSERTIQAKFF